MHNISHFGYGFDGVFFHSFSSSLGGIWTSNTLTMGFNKSITFGSSSGGIFGFQFAYDFPQMVDNLIAHEAPTSYLLPDASEIFN